MQQQKGWRPSKGYFKAFGQLYGDTLCLPIAEAIKPPVNKKTSLKIDLPTEREEGVSLIRYSDAKKLPIVHTPNEGKRTQWQGAILRSQGLRAGYPDYTLYLPRKGYGALMIELKRQKGGKISDLQQHWLDLLNKNGYKAVVCYGAEHAIREIESYLS